MYGWLKRTLKIKEKGELVMMTPLFGIAIIVISFLGILKLTPWLLKQSIEASREITATIFFTTAMTSVIIEITMLVIVLFCAVVPNGLVKNTAIPEHPVVITIDKLIAGEEIPVEEMRPLLAATIYQCAELWANRKNIPKEKKDYVISVVTEAIRKATVKIELPPEIAEYVKTKKE